MYFPTFTQIFNEFDDQTLIELAMYNPGALQKMCQFLTVTSYSLSICKSIVKKGN